MWHEQAVTVLPCGVVLAAIISCVHGNSGKFDANEPAPRCRPDNVFSCYECKTSTSHPDHYCGDPFNETHPEVKAVTCEDFCAKWVVRLKSGAMQTVRTCSNGLELHLRIFPVCMKESGSQEGHVCFCTGQLCNNALSLPRISVGWTTFELLVVTVIMSKLL